MNPTATPTSTGDEPVTSASVPSDQRIDFLARRFGCYHLHLERAVFDMAGRLIEGHTGGFWEFRTLSNGGAYFVPPAYASKTVPPRLYVVVASNGFEGYMSPDAAGVAVTLFALSHLCFARRGDPEERVQILVQRFDDLRAYAAGHPEASAIFGAID
ncbi:MAG: antirestriction protein [Lautropia sp.]